MKFITLLLTAALAVPAFSATLEEERAVIRDVLAYHFDVTQPFYRDYVVVTSRSRAVAPEERWNLEALLNDPGAAERIRKALAATAQATIALDGVDTPSYPLQDLSSYRLGATYDWRKIGDAAPLSQRVVFEVSRPVFDPERPYAVVQLQCTKIRGVETGFTLRMLYGMEQQADGSWKLADAITDHHQTP